MKLGELKGERGDSLTKLLKQDPTYNEWVENRIANSTSSNPQKIWHSCSAHMRKYVEFLTRNPETDLELTLVDLIAETRNHPTAKPAQHKISLFYKWMIGKFELDGELIEKPLRKTNNITTVKWVGLF